MADVPQRRLELEATLAAFRAYAERSGWTIAAEKELQGGYQLVVSDGLSQTPLSLYASGKALIQGKPSELQQDIQSWWESFRAGHAASSAAVPAARLAGVARVGMDESGKGDYFGPLVIAAVYADAELERKLLALGVQDSKRIADSQVMRLSDAIRELAPHSLVVISPRRYNELYAQIGNLNALLAWGHARALESVLEQTPCERALADQFGDEAYLLKALLARGRQVRLEQRPRAEEDLAVAAASIMARSAFVRRLAQLSRGAGLELPKGSSNPAIVEAARSVARAGGRAALADVAKLHFKTTASVLPS